MANSDPWSLLLTSDKQFSINGQNEQEISQQGKSASNYIWELD